MISNEERRNIAERLRKTPDIDDISQDELMYVLDDKLENNLKENGANEFEICETIVKRISDLIEPKTCRKIPGRMKYGRRMPACSECGYSLGDSRWNFCPKCGCEVSE